MSLLLINLNPQSLLILSILSGFPFSLLRNGLSVYPVRAEAVSNQNCKWNYNNLEVILSRDQVVTCLTACLHKTTLEVANYEKLQEVI